MDNIKDMTNDEFMTHLMTGYSNHGALVQSVVLDCLQRGLDHYISHKEEILEEYNKQSLTAPVKMSDFSISAVSESLGGFTYLFEQTAENYEVRFSNAGSLFTSRIASRTQNLSWSFDGTLDVTIGSADYIAQVTAGPITNTDAAIAGTFNQSGSIKASNSHD